MPTGPAAPATVAEGAPLAWSYQGDRGPDAWATLRPEWSACGGPGQSPIDLPLDGLGSAKVEPTLGISVELPPSTFELDRSGPLVTLVGGSNQALTMDGHRSVIDRIELHAPAEHRLGGASFDVELVLAARTAAEGPVLLSLLFRTGAQNQALVPLLEQLSATPTPTDVALELALLLPKDAQILAYEGSLSTPPCTTGVTRLVVARVGELSADQLAALRKVVPASSRPVTNRGERSVTLRSLASPSPAPTASTTTPQAP